jgi:hypothetical protein
MEFPFGNINLGVNFCESGILSGVTSAEVEILAIRISPRTLHVEATALNLN